MDYKTFETRLQRISETAVSGLKAHPRAAQVLAGTADAETYASYLVTAHATVREAQSLLRAASAQLAAEGRAPVLAALLSEKCAEEAGHERWIEADLDAIGLPLGGPDTPRPGKAAEVYLSTNRALIGLCGATFLGTALVLETLAVGCAGEVARNLRANARIAGIGPHSTRGLTFLSAHHAADQDHTEELMRVLLEVEEPRLQEFVLLGAELTARVYPEFFSHS